MYGRIEYRLALGYAGMVKITKFSYKSVVGLLALSAAQTAQPLGGKMRVEFIFVFGVSVELVYRRDL